MNLLITLFQELNIDEKLKEAPDDYYSIGILIGNLVPFLVLVAIAYIIYRYNKNRYKEE
ncbi:MULTISPECIES: hypothetical protein [Winogradskyella]|uniref:hypothetical protein n=1 Tax=Winogradskyella TaxID=286104 RepID=UPI0015CD16D3|nr:MULTISPECIES: hypothetical protein [Winogradskyella]QXP80517.1 hypothetical protein H0I32_07820 [Winogradskyella sp. HaHa_3_26]